MEVLFYPSYLIALALCLTLKYLIRIIGLIFNILNFKKNKFSKNLRKSSQAHNGKYKKYHSQHVINWSLPCVIYLVHDRVPRCPNLND